MAKHKKTTNPPTESGQGYGTLLSNLSSLLDQARRTAARTVNQDLTAKHGRGFSEWNLRLMRAFSLGWQIRQTLSAKFETRVAAWVGQFVRHRLAYSRRESQAPR